MKTKQHWETTYASKNATEVSWYQMHATQSLALIKRAETDLNQPIIDVGGGASTLVDDLLRYGYEDLSVLDISAQALSVAKSRLGTQAQSVTWLEYNILEAQLPSNHYAVWHDRAVFHFLTEANEREQYLTILQQALRIDGRVIMATFALDGPKKCSGLPTQRYSIELLTQAMGSAFELVEHTTEMHTTPAGKPQHFIYAHFRRAHG